MRRSIYLTAALLQFSLLFVMDSKAQQGLLLPSTGTRSATDRCRLEMDSWHQFQSPPNDANVSGAAFTYCPYFPKSLSEFRVKVGSYSNGNQTLSENNSLTSYLIIPASSRFAFSTGFTKLFPQLESKSYYELAFNADFHYSYMVFKDPNKFAVSTYLLRAGLEVIPIPRTISLYANLDLLMGASGVDQYLSNRSALLEKAEYFDAGIKVVLLSKTRFNISPDFNFIFAEKRITAMLPSHDTVVPNFKLALIYRLK